MLRHPNIIAFKKVRRRRPPPRIAPLTHAPWRSAQALLTATHLAIVMEFAAGALWRRLRLRCAL